MAQDKKSFILYADQRGVFNQLPDELAGKLIKHIFAYVSDENPQSEDLIINIAFEPIKQSLKRDLQRWQQYIDKQADNGKKGGRPKKANETQKTQAFLEKPKKADSVSVSVNVNDNDNDNENVNVNYNDNTNDNNEFIDIWSLYGKVGNKTTAMAKYNRLTKKDKESVKEHIPKYIKNHFDNDKQEFIPHFTTYLNQRRWEDDLPYKPKETKQPFQLRNVATLDDD